MCTTFPGGIVSTKGRASNSAGWPRRVGRGTVLRPPSRWEVATFTALLYVAGARRVSGQGKASSECQVKAAFLSPFAQFVDRPSRQVAITRDSGRKSQRN